MKYFSGFLAAVFAISLTAQTVNYTYDQAGRLSGVIYPNGTTATYTYDASGNLLRKIIAATGTGPAPAPFKGGVANAASEVDAPIAPGEMVVIYGNGLGPSTL